MRFMIFNEKGEFYTGNRFATLADLEAFMEGARARDGRDILQYVVPPYIQEGGSFRVNPAWESAPYEEVIFKTDGKFMRGGMKIPT